MGEKLGISQGYVAQIETETVNASPRIAEKILRMAGKSRTEIDSIQETDTEEEVNFGDWVEEQRSKRGLSRRSPADKAGISYLALYFIETGQTQSPRENTVNAIKRVIGELPKGMQTEVVESAEGGFGKFQGPFSIKEWEEEVDGGTPGVYIFYDILMRPVYIGQSKDIRKRILDHDREFWFKSPMVDKIAYLVVKDEAIRLKLEAAMIKLVGENAIFNSQHKIE
jgi:transcriptional regulator with XRE-family HTH domain